MSIWQFFKFQLHLKDVICKSQQIFAMFNFHQFLFTSKIMPKLNYAIYYLEATAISISFNC